MRNPKPKAIISNGYRLLLTPDHQRANPNGYVMEHVLVVERALGIRSEEEESKIAFDARKERRHERRQVQRLAGHRHGSSRAASVVVRMSEKVSLPNQRLFRWRPGMGPAFMPSKKNKCKHDFIVDSLAGMRICRRCTYEEKIR